MINVKAIVLNRCNIGEYDQHVTLFSLEMGKKRLLGKGLKKITSKNSTSLMTGSLVEAQIVKGKKIDYLVKVQTINIYRNIRDDLEKNIVLMNVLYLTDLMTDIDLPEINIFNLLKNLLQYLDQAQSVHQSIVYMFLLKLSVVLGFEPQLEKCAFCDKLNSEFFNIVLSSAVCQLCINVAEENTNNIKLAKGELDSMRTMLSGNWDEVQKINISIKVKGLIIKMASYNSEKKIKILKI